MDPLSLLSADALTALLYVVGVLIAATSLVGTVALALAAIKPRLGLPSPDDGVWKRRAFRLCELADPVAANTTLVKDALLIVKKELELEGARRALAQQHEVIELQARVIRESLRPAPMPAFESDVETAPERPSSKRGE